MAMRREKCLKPVVHEGRAGKAYDNGADGKDPQRAGHDRGGFMDVMLMPMRVFFRPAFSEKGEKDKPEHIKGRHKSRDQQEPKNKEVSGFKSRQQDFIFGPESGEWRNSGNGQRCDHKSGRGVRHLFEKPAHFPKVLGAAAVNDASGAKKEQGLEKGVGHQMKSSGDEASHAHGRDHESELGNG